MSTNKIILRTTDEFMADYVPVYNPVYPLFLSKSQQYAAEVGLHNFKRVEAVGDIRAKHITPKDTEIQQVAVMEGKKTFKKYFLAKQFVQSAIQDQQGNEDVISQVLDEHQKHMDELFMYGDGTAANNVVNNGLFHSADPYYTLESSAQIASANRLLDFHNKVVDSCNDADQISGRKVVIFYGNVVPLFNSLHTGSETPVKSALAEVLGTNFSLIQMPKAVMPQSGNGWIVANLDQVKLHYTALPQLLDQGVNAEKMYTWHNFFMGSTMLEILAKDGVIHQPTTLE